MGGNSTPDPTGQTPCSAERQWDELAAGLILGDRADAMLEHASACDPCAELLRASVDVFQREVVPERPVLELRRPASGRPRWIPWTIAAALVAAMGTLLYVRFERDPLAQLARIYSHNRSLEPRIAGAAYGPLRMERGSSKPLAEQPEEMLESAARIRHALAGDPHSARWLHAKGRLALLEWQPEEAIQALTESQDLGGSSAPLSIDLAVAYYEQAQHDQDPTAWNHALDLLGRALQMDPASPAALFNRALVLEQLHETQPAIEDLEKLLIIEPRGAWSEESRNILTRLREKHRSYFERPPGEDAARFDEVELDRMLVSGSVPGEFAPSWFAAHGDRWLQDLQSVSRGSEISAGILARTAAVRLAVERGRYEKEREVFARIEHLDLPPPLAAWRDFEALYRATHARGEFACPADPHRLLDVLRRRSYLWLLTQALREQSYCSFQAGDLEAAEQFARQSVEQSRGHAFPVAAMRSEAIFAHIAIRRGRFVDAFRRAQEALAGIERQRLPVSRSHEFLNISMVVSRSQSRWYSARSFAEGMTEAARVAGFADLEFTSMVAWAELAARCGDGAEAKRLFQGALDFYHGLAPNDDRAWAEIGLADATGDESRLDPFASQVEASSDSLLWIPYQRVRAKLALAHGRPEEARTRLNRIRDWMNAATPEQSLRWQSEFRATAEVNLDLLAREGQIQDSFDLLQVWRHAETPRPAFQTAEGAPVPFHQCVIFSFAAVGPRFAAWRREDARTEFRWVPAPRDRIERLVRQFNRLLGSPTSSADEIQEVGAQIEAALFGDWLRHVAKGEELLIQADDALANLAFAALPGASEPLGIEHSISMTRYPVPDVSPALPAVPFTGRLLIVDASHARTVWGAELPTLVSVGNEIAAIQRLNGSSAQVIRGEDATAALLIPQLPQAETLHFAGHAMVTGNGVALVLSNSDASGGLLDLNTTAGAFPRLVVLSACSTGLKTTADVDTGDPDSLTTAILKKGSREVVASLWNVDSDSTASLMAQFYTSLHQGFDVGQALRQAMGSIRGSARFSHPYYWAAFAHFVRA